MLLITSNNVIIFLLEYWVGSYAQPAVLPLKIKQRDIYPLPSLLQQSRLFLGYNIFAFSLLCTIFLILLVLLSFPLPFFGITFFTDMLALLHLFSWISRSLFSNFSIRYIQSSSFANHIWLFLGAICYLRFLNWFWRLKKWALHCAAFVAFQRKEKFFLEPFS